MAKIRKVEIRHFRSLESLDWFPAGGMNCLIGPGDSGKSTVLEAVDLCLGARRSIAFSDVDFHLLDCSQPITIRVSLGDLPQSLKSIDDYGEFHQGFQSPDKLLDEPQRKLETVLTIELAVAADMEPRWRLYSKRTADSSTTRMLPWKERVALAPARLGSYSSSNLAWGRGSVLNRLSDERAEVNAELFAAARKAREVFGDTAQRQLGTALDTVTRTANELGINVGDGGAKALLDAHSASFGEGAIALHDASGVPLRSLGAGSARLLVAGLHQAAAKVTSIVISDEVEIGLEPHRIGLLLKSLGAKDESPSLQCFLTTHSPVVVRELTSEQLFIVRRQAAEHKVLRAAVGDDIQATLRAEPEAFLAKSVVVCEGASERGLVRGLDRFWMGQGQFALEAHGLATVNANGGSPAVVFKRAFAMQSLGYRCAVFLDHDQGASDEDIVTFEGRGGTVIRWSKGLALEDAIFAALPKAGVSAALEMACGLHGDSTINDHICSKSDGKAILAAVREEAKAKDYSPQTRKWLGQAARVKKAGWFKEERHMDRLAYSVIGPQLSSCSSEFTNVVLAMALWARTRA